MIAIVDYGVGNLFSILCSLRHVGAQAEVTGDPARLEAADKLLLPGVGAFGDAAARLRETGLGKVVAAQARAGKPLLGVCLGMQLLYERGYEYGEHEGLGLIPGEILPMTEALLGAPLKIPHMGWNSLDFRGDCPLLKYIREGDFVYYVHSYYAALSAQTAASSRYGALDVTGIVQSGNVFGAQFHPEKSGDVGLKILKAFAEA